MKSFVGILPPGVLGALGGAGAAWAGSAGQRAVHRVIESVGGAAAGLALGSLPSLGRQVLRTGRQLLELVGGFPMGSTAAGAVAALELAPLQNALRAGADRQGSLALRAQGTSFKAYHAFLEVLIRALAGALAGALGASVLAMLLDYLTGQLR